MVNMLTEIDLEDLCLEFINKLDRDDLICHLQDAMRTIKSLELRNEMLDERCTELQSYVDNDWEGKIEELEDEIDDLRELRDGYESDWDVAETRNDELETLVDELKDEIADLKDKLASYEADS